jgi:hypothetical protein
MLTGVKRTQIYLEERHDRELARRAAERHTTKSELIREALDAYLGPEDAEAEALRRFREGVEAAYGIAPYLPDGLTYVRRLREIDAQREKEIEERWRG